MVSFNPELAFFFDELRSPRVSACDVLHVRLGVNPCAALLIEKIAHLQIGTVKNLKKAESKTILPFWFPRKTAYRLMRRLLVGFETVFAKPVDPHFHILNQSRKGALHRFGINI